MEKRGSGVLLHISSLPSPYGVGDFGPGAYWFADFLAETKQAFWQILPLNPTDPVCGNSPYFSHSAFAANPLFISIEQLLDEGLVSETDLDSPPEVGPETTDYDMVAEYRGKILDKAYKRFKSIGGGEQYHKFCSEHSGWLDDFSLFSALKNEFKGQPWNRWPREIRDRKPDILEKARQKLRGAMERERFFQYLLFKQWASLKTYCNRKGTKIIGDLPIYVSYDSSDVWVNHHIFKLDEEKMPYALSGVPPDYFSATGQLWNNPVYRWDVLQETGYDWWIKRMEHALNCFDIIRIDHFRGLVKYWEVPAHEKTAINGEWQDVPTHDFFDTLVGRFPDFPVIAEDLGFITPDVRQVMAHFELSGMKVFVFAFGDDDPMHPYLPHTYPRNCVAYTGTHDNNTLIGWFERETTPEQRQRLFRYLYKEGLTYKINWEVIRLLMMSVANIVIIPMQDILGLGQGARMNQPATSFGNWRWRLVQGQITPSIVEKLLTVTETYGRG